MSKELSAKDKEINLTFYKDGYNLAINNITNFKTLTPLFMGMQANYQAVSQLTQSFAQRAIEQETPIACKKGCKWCCYQPVYLTTNEALLIHEYMHQAFDESQRARLLTNAKQRLKKTKGLEEEKKQDISHACPFLIEGACSIYPVRPMSCRVYLSSDESSCKMKYDNPKDKSDFPKLFDFILRAGRYMNEGFVGFIKAKEKTVEEYTIEEFMVKIFSDEKLRNDWLEK
ncbi:YkgJ family cysteine cluster protein [Saccharicrinis aurantiacus]|uniref:YkgJ family cysteine cluster protein n=1 Tax=Saccharicrinis aurantiacus TaxID=1849719 RepID=UPI00249208B8|nr:YkgJ family cysteine cluster protein [Saccharicrinis aurantiacus]